jgi:hypothetical protein
MPRKARDTVAIEMSKRSAISLRLAEPSTAPISDNFLLGITNDYQSKTPQTNHYLHCFAKTIPFLAHIRRRTEIYKHPLVIWDAWRDFTFPLLLHPCCPFCGRALFPVPAIKTRKIERILKPLR